jgi:predicted component of type VI protein secretion system
MVAEPVRLEVVAGRAEGMSILVDDELVIGRQADGAGRLADDDEISRSHARVTLDASGFCAIEDLGSTNGTFVNGLRISAPQTLFDGDTIELGGTTLVVRGPPQTPADAPLAADAAVAPAEEDVSAPSAGEGAAPPLAPDIPAPATVFGSVPPPASEEAVTPEPDVTIIPGAITEAPHEMAGEAVSAAFRPTEAGEEANAAFTPIEAGEASAPAVDSVQTSVQIAVDFAARELTITLAGEDQPLRLVYDGQRWRTDASAE